MHASKIERENQRVSGGSDVKMRLNPPSQHSRLSTRRHLPFSRLLFIQRIVRKLNARRCGV